MTESVPTSTDIWVILPSGRTISLPPDSLVKGTLLLEASACRAIDCRQVEGHCCFLAGYTEGTYVWYTAMKAPGLPRTIFIDYQSPVGIKVGPPLDGVLDQSIREVTLGLYMACTEITIRASVPSKLDRWPQQFKFIGKQIRLDLNSLGDSISERTLFHAVSLLGASPNPTEIWYADMFALNPSELTFFDQSDDDRPDTEVWQDCFPSMVLYQKGT
ncbi:hypothetical protein M231_04358 [Tremella mesenterica]|uniref:Uncharacterized protein n=1 Tax=Tremella mesenterica TaxID=5217 RepID=A0A4Q1BKT6_TREME|nr:hypothetical protein M231_04358 [Tremella mesenterica]